MRLSQGASGKLSVMVTSDGCADSKTAISSDFLDPVSALTRHALQALPLFKRRATIYGEENAILPSLGEQIY